MNAMSRTLGDDSSAGFDPIVEDRAIGALLGLALGDALGTALEFLPPGTFEPIDDIVGGGPFGLEAGKWTDDTSMALCLADSLIGQGGFDAEDQMRRYVGWWRNGDNSATGTCFDIGNTVAGALRRALWPDCRGVLRPLRSSGRLAGEVALAAGNRGAGKKAHRINQPWCKVDNDERAVEEDDQ